MSCAERIFMQTGQKRNHTNNRADMNNRNDTEERTDTNNRAVGTFWENRAAAFLQAQGLRILARNYRCRQGEIDLIAYDGRYLIFAEVKYRSSSRCANPLSAVNGAKQKRICRAADYYRFQEKVPQTMPVRYDVIGILGEKITWIPNAFCHWGT